MSHARGIKALVKNLVHRAMRPGLWPLYQRTETIEKRMDNQAVRLQSINLRTDAWAKTMNTLPARLDKIEEALERITASHLARDKHHEELAYWKWLIKTEAGRASLYAPFEIAFARWQRDRLRELARAMGLAESAGVNGSRDPVDPALDEWCARQSVVEIGAGPYPAIAAAPAWRRAVAIDPLAKCYAEEGLLPAAANHVTYIEAPGEHLPLPPGFADLVVMDNALDHVSDPGAVLTEIKRVLRAGGLFWLLVDLSTHKDHMHPHPFDELSLRALLREKGFEIVTDRVSGHKSHPNAYGEYRGLLRKVGANPSVVVTDAARDVVGAGTLSR
jgi:SAM-dependent methyltransferase